MLKFFNHKLLKLNLVDIKLLQLAAMMIAFILVKIFPEILNISYIWFIVAAFLFALEPVIKILES